MRYIRLNAKRCITAPLYPHGQRGASGLLMAMAVSAILLIVVGSMQIDTDNSIQVTTKLKSLAEIRRANQSAMEAVSQMLNSGGLTIPLPGNRSYSTSKTDGRENQDSGALLTNWALTVNAGIKNIKIDKSTGGKVMLVSTCAGNKLSPADFGSIYSTLTGELACAKKIVTAVELKEVTIASYGKGFFTMDKKVADEARSRGHYYEAVGQGYEVYGLIRRNFRIEARTKFDRGLFSMGAVGSDMNSTNEVADQAILTSMSDTHAHGCRWQNPTWQERIMFRPPIAGGGWGDPMYAYVSRTLAHAGDAGVSASGEISMSSGIKTNGLNCPYVPDANAKDIKGQVGGVHQHLGEVRGWGANVCDYGTMFYIVNPDQVDCSISLVPLRWEGNYVGGCFATGTPIRMADGSERSVEDLKAGDKVLNPVTGQPQSIASTRKGYESKGLIEVGYDGKTIRVTENHPFIMPGNALRQARSLALGDSVLGHDGRYHKVTTLSQAAPEPYTWVHNLSLVSDSGAPEHHAVLAGGIVTGDHFLQNQLEAQIYAETSRAVRGGVKRAASLSAAIPALHE